MNIVWHALDHLLRGDHYFELIDLLKGESVEQSSKQTETAST